MSKFRKTKFRDLLKILVADAGPDHRPPAQATCVCTEEGLLGPTSVCLDASASLLACSLAAVSLVQDTCAEGIHHTEGLPFTPLPSSP